MQGKPNEVVVNQLGMARPEVEIVHFAVRVAWGSWPNSGQREVRTVELRSCRRRARSLGQLRQYWHASGVTPSVL
jgi:hypothetical protein